jgi:hypothetical protein
MMRWKATLLLTFVLLTAMGCKLFQPSTVELPPASPLEPLPDEASMSRGEVSISSQELLIMESYPLQVALLIKGTLPTPCHKLRVEVSEPDIQNIIAVEAYSLVDPNQNCIQVLEPFDENIPLGSYPDGSYTVTLNGEEVGEFTQ